MPRELRAGSWTVVLGERGELSSVRLGDEEVLRGLAGVVRDADWGTVDGEVQLESLSVGDDSFSVIVRSEHSDGDIDFSWTGTLSGTSESTVRFEFDGIANRAFRSNRVGLVALHSLNWSGRPVRITHADGSIENTAYPRLISPHQPFFSITSMHQTGVSGADIEIVFEGDEFETEDQRNWTDASFKTYSRPLALPFPMDFAAGARVHQAVTLNARGVLPAPAASENALLEFTIGKGTAVWPRLGLCLATTPRSAAADAAIRKMRPGWLRTDVHLDADGVLHGTDSLARAGVLGIPLELAITVADPAPSDTSELEEVLGRTEIAHILVYTEGTPSTASASLDCVREAIVAGGGDPVPLFAGTDGNFTELNRFPIDTPKLDGLVFSINPQVHDTSDRAVMQTIETYPAIVETARSLAKKIGRAGGSSNPCPLSISPITLKPRRNLYATQPEAQPAPGVIAAATVDPRQPGPFTAAWTAAVLGALGEAEVDQLTVFEHAGPRGVVSASGEPYEVYDVLRVAFAGDHAVPHTSSDPSTVTGFVVRNKHGVTAVLANVTPDTRQVRVRGLTSDSLERTIEPFSVIIVHNGEK